MRIMSGAYRGRNIKAPDIDATHPMGARERLALMNMLSDILPEARVLDLFAGSGALGIEALSRGAKEVVFVENSAVATSTIRQNLSNLGLSDFAEVTRQSVEKYLKNPDLARVGFEVIFVDPPYDKYDSRLFQKAGDLLRTGGKLALSHPKDTNPSDFGGLALEKTRSYASARISIYRKTIA